MKYIAQDYRVYPICSGHMIAGNRTGSMLYLKCGYFKDMNYARRGDWRFFKMVDESNYLKYRGKCKEFCEKEIEKDPSLILVRGYFDCPLWGRQQHWWCKKPNGEIVDPNVKQFPMGGVCGEYIEFDGYLACEQCGKITTEQESVFVGRYPTCSNKCAMQLVGL